MLFASRGGLRRALDAAPVLGGRVVEMALEPQLPPVEVDEAMIRRTLVNILENAARHDPGPLALRAAHVDGFLEIRVVDHGPGLRRSHHRRKLRFPGCESARDDGESR